MRTLNKYMYARYTTEWTQGLCIALVECRTGDGNFPGTIWRWSPPYDRIDAAKDLTMARDNGRRVCLYDYRDSDDED